MKIDLSGVTTTEYLGTGKHFVKVVDVKDEHEYIQVRFQDKNGAIHQERFYLRDSVKWRIAALAKACGIWDDGQAKIDSEDLIGCYLYITIEEQEYNGKTYRNVAKFEASGLPKDTKIAHQNKKQQEQLPEVDIDEDDIPF
ncbi:MAG: hypothetical protein GXO16_05820 [Epsilonproteobacteria bacterium]|nr:hypothetical protein [Campylobacterota bacterium]